MARRIVPRHMGDRWYRLLLLLFPTEFRDEFGPEMSDVFSDERRAARTKGSWWLLRLWVRTAPDLVAVAIRQHADMLRADVRYALRMMRKAPGATAVLVALLAVGIGANTAVFALIDATLLRPLPVPSGDRVVRVRLMPGATVSYANYVDLRDRVSSMSQLAAHQYAPVSFGMPESNDTVIGELVTGNYFDLMRVPMFIGRALSPADDRPGAPPIVVLGHGLWRSRFGGDASIVGRSVLLNGHAFAVVGVAPARFTGSYGAGSSAFWVPVWTYQHVRPRNLPLTLRGWGWLSMTGRLRDGVTERLATDEVQRIFAQIVAENRKEHPQQAEVLRASGVPEPVQGPLRMVLLFSMAVVSAVLLVMCVNIAGVLHARMLGRRNEIAIRLALGASRPRIVRQWLTEHVLLAALGSVASVLVALVMREAVVRAYGTALPLPELALIAGPRVFGFTAAVALAAALLFGLAPTLRAARTGDRALHETGLTVTGGRRRTAYLLLTGAQVAASLVLLVAAGLLARSLHNAEAFNVGFQTGNLALGSVDLERHGYSRDRAHAFLDQVAARLRGSPAIQGVSWANVVPLGGSVERLGMRIEGHASSDGKPVPIDVNMIGPDYFATMGIPIVQGRVPDAGIRTEAVINETFARRYWPDTHAIGRHVKVDDTDATIVGVARDIKYYEIGEAPRPYIYFPTLLSSSPYVIHVRSGDPVGALAAIRREARTVDAGVAVDLKTFEDLRRGPLLASRAMSAVSTLFGLLTLVLTLVGLYGTISRSVLDRSREIAVRMAFGADRPSVLRMVLCQGLTPVAAGVAVGLALSAVATQLLTTQLFGIGALDVPTYLGVAVGLALSAAAAAYVPARRAARLDPIQILRTE